MSEVDVEGGKARPAQADRLLESKHSPEEAPPAYEASNGTARVKVVDGKDGQKKRERFISTTVLYIAVVAFGISLGSMGPSLLDLALLTKTDVKTISTVFIAKNSGAVIGCLVGGIILDKYSRPLFMGISMAILGALFIVVPWCQPFSVMVVILVLFGLAYGAHDTGLNAVCIGIWGPDRPEFFQALHFLMIVGAVLSPIIVSPFLADRATICADNIDIIQNSIYTKVSHGNARGYVIPEIKQNGTSNLQTDILQTTAQSVEMLVNCNTTVSVVGETGIHYSYIIMGVVCMLAALPFFFTYRMEKRREEQEKKEVSEEAHVSLQTFRSAELQVPDEKPDHESKPYVILVSIMIFVFYVLVGGIEDAFPGMISTFSVERLGWTSKMGSILTSLYFGAMAATRLILLFVSKFIKAEILLFVHLAILMASMVALVFAVDQNEAVIWVCTAAFGVGQASVFASSFTWFSRYVSMTGKMTALVTIAYFSGTMSFPPIVGALIHSKELMLFPMLMGVSGLVQFMLAIVFCLVFRRKKII